MTAESAMLSYYAARASEYDGIYKKPERQSDLRAIEKWLPPLFSDSNVLEIACGTGYWTPFIATSASTLLAIDAALETINIARCRIPARNVEFRVFDAYALAALGKKFDAAFAGFWFSHVPRQRQEEFLAGLGAILRPGARVVFLDNRFVDGSSTPIAEKDTDGNTSQTRTLADGSVHRVLKNFPTEDELRSLSCRVGTQARFTTWPHYWAFDYLATGSKLVR